MKQTSGKKFQFKFTALAAPNVDVENELLHDVVILQKGEAKGHGVQITDATLDSFMALGVSKVKAFMTHGDCFSGDRLNKVLGFFSGIYRDGDMIKAKTFEFLDKAKKFDPESVATIMEMSQKMPGEFGMSISFWADTIDPKQQDPKCQESAYVLCKELFSVDFVSEPAATTSLFTRLLSAFRGKIPELKGLGDAVAKIHAQVEGDDQEPIVAAAPEAAPTVVAEAPVVLAATAPVTNVADVQSALDEATTRLSASESKLAERIAEIATLTTKLAEAEAKTKLAETAAAEVQAKLDKVAKMSFTLPIDNTSLENVKMGSAQALKKYEQLQAKDPVEAGRFYSANRDLILPKS